MENVALFFHLLGAFSFVAGTVVAGVAFEVARRRRTPAEVALLLGLSRIGVLLVALGTLLVLGFGLWLVDLGDWGYGAGWVDAALGLLAAMVILGALGGQRPSRRASSPAVSPRTARQSARSCGRCSTTARRSRPTTSRPCSCSRSSR